MRLHLRFTNLHGAAIRATKLLLDCDLYAEPEQTFHYFQSWIETACATYDLPIVHLVYDPDFGGSLYEANAGVIFMTNPSVLTLLHQFRHHMQTYARNPPATSRSQELDAQGWACSLFYTADPERFKRLVYDGAVVAVSARDMEQVSPMECTGLNEDEQRVFDEVAESVIEGADDEFAQLMEQFTRGDL